VNRAIFVTSADRSRGESVSFPHERGRVLVARERFGLPQGRLQILLEIRGQPAVIPGGRGVARQKQHVGQVVHRLEVERLEVEHARHQHDAVQ
jgi:hypothetical protein